MLDDNKRTNDVKTWLTEREFVDLCKMAEREDRKPSEMLRVMARRFMYGNVGAAQQDINGVNRADQGNRE